METKTIKKQEAWKNLNQRGRNLSKKASDYNNLIRHVERNCDAMRDSASDAHLMELDAMGNHLSDPVFQKLARNYLKEDIWSSYGYMNDALTRIGNRTMVEEEYNLLQEVSEDRLIDYRLDPRLREIKEKFYQTIPGVGAPWHQSPFGHRLIRIQ